MQSEKGETALSLPVRRACCVARHNLLIRHAGHALRTEAAPCSLNLTPVHLCARLIPPLPSASRPLRAAAAAPRHPSVITQMSQAVHINYMRQAVHPHLHAGAAYSAPLVAPLPEPLPLFVSAATLISPCSGPKESPPACRRCLHCQHSPPPHLADAAYPFCSTPEW